MTRKDLDMTVMDKEISVLVENTGVPVEVSYDDLLNIRISSILGGKELYVAQENNDGILMRVR